MLIASAQNRRLAKSLEPYLELRFPVLGSTWPADQNYPLFSAISKRFPKLHNLEELSLNTISGIPNKQGTIELTETSHLSLRCPSIDLLTVLPLAGSTLEIEQYSLKLGHPEVRTLSPFSELKARLVTIKHPSGKFEQVTPEWFLDACYRQLKTLGITASVGIPLNEAGEPARKTLKISKRKVKQGQRQTYQILGYSIVVANLMPEDSILLQAKGIGGKRRMGCGYFTSYRLDIEA